MSEIKELYDDVVKGGYDFGTGSWAVVNNKIKMKLNNIGEYHPYVDFNENFSTDEINKLKNVCLSLSLKNEDDISRELFSNISGIKYDKRLGYYLGLYIGHVDEGSFRSNGSSGGFGTWILSELLKSNKVDYVISVIPTNQNNKLFKYFFVVLIINICYLFSDFFVSIIFTFYEFL